MAKIILYFKLYQELIFKQFLRYHESTNGSSNVFIENSALLIHLSILDQFLRILFSDEVMEISFSSLILFFFILFTAFENSIIIPHFLKEKTFSHPLSYLLYFFIHLLLYVIFHFHFIVFRYAGNFFREYYLSLYHY